MKAKTKTKAKSYARSYASDIRECTPKEAKIVGELMSIAKRWPKTLCMFAGGEGGGPWVMHCDENGLVPHARGGGCDQDYVIVDLDITSDGGGW